MTVDLSKYQSDFPILSRKVRGDNRFIYLDSGATSQKPESVITAEADFTERRMLQFTEVPILLLKKLRTHMKELEPI